MKVNYKIVVLCLSIIMSCAPEVKEEQEQAVVEDNPKESVKSDIKEVEHYVHAHGMPFKGKILMVASSPAVSEQTGWPIGFWAAELTHPLHVFQEAGYEVALASTEGGEIKMDNYSTRLTKVATLLMMLFPSDICSKIGLMKC